MATLRIINGGASDGASREALESTRLGLLKELNIFETFIEGQLPNQNVPQDLLLVEMKLHFGFVIVRSKAFAELLGSQIERPSLGSIFGAPPNIIAEQMTLHECREQVITDTGSMTRIASRSIPSGSNNRREVADQIGNQVRELSMSCSGLAAHLAPNIRFRNFSQLI